MCTLTYIHTEKGAIITSSRDEKTDRKSLLPREYEINGKKIFFSKDIEKNGTWLALNNKTVVCLLNGAEENLGNELFFTESRGKIVLERFRFEDNLLFFNQLNLENFAPFTMVIFDFDKKNIEEIIWNGNEKTLRKVTQNTSKIWSSSTLYTKEIRQKRELWFSEFLNQNPNINTDTVFKFHTYPHTDNSEQNIFMKRNDGKQTVSISQIEILDSEVNYRFWNVFDNTEEKKQWKEMDLQLP